MPYKIRCENWDSSKSFVKINTSFAINEILVLVLPKTDYGEHRRQGNEKSSNH